MLKSLEDIQVFLDMNYKMFGQAVSKYTIVLVLYACNVMTAFDPPFERLFYEDFNGGFRLKGEYVICYEKSLSYVTHGKITEHNLLSHEGFRQGRVSIKVFSGHSNPSNLGGGLMHLL